MILYEVLQWVSTMVTFVLLSGCSDIGVARWLLCWTTRLLGSWWSSGKCDWCGCYGVAMALLCYPSWLLDGCYTNTLGWLLWYYMRLLRGCHDITWRGYMVAMLHVLVARVLRFFAPLYKPDMFRQRFPDAHVCVNALTSPRICVRRTQRRASAQSSHELTTR